MASPYLIRACRPGVLPQPFLLRSRLGGLRQFSESSAAQFRPSSAHRQHSKERFGSRLSSALKNTKVQWYPIPIGLGIGFLGFLQFYKTQAREKERLEQEALETEPGQARTKRRPRIRPDGPWYEAQIPMLPRVRARY
jgi:phosphatidylserine decarboxylase